MGWTYGSDGDGEGGLVGDHVDIGILSNDALDSRH